MARTVTIVKKNANKADLIITDTTEIDFAEERAKILATIANLDATRAQYVTQLAELDAAAAKHI